MTILQSLSHRVGRIASAAILTAGVLCQASPAEAQLDPLLFLKRLPPNVIVVVDTSLSMLEDGAGNFYDPNTYAVADSVLTAFLMGVNPSQSTHYRRVYEGLGYEGSISPTSKYTTTTISTVSNDAADFEAFWDQTRLEITKQGIAQAVAENGGIQDGWALIGLRQQNPVWRAIPDCDRPVRVTGNGLLSLWGDFNPCHAGGGNKYALYPPKVDVPNYTLTSSSGVLLPFGASNTAVISLVNRSINDPLGLIPAGHDSQSHEDRPIALALEDALTQTSAAIAAGQPNSTDCRNTVVVLITGGPDAGDPTYLGSHNATQTASAFSALSVQGTTARAPIFVAAVKPEAGEDQLQGIATASGGKYFNVSDAAGVTRVINVAIQSAYARGLDYNLGLPSEFQPVSPVVGTVNLTNASAAQGGSLSGTTVLDPGGQEIPQRSNVMVTAGFEVNGPGTTGMEGVLRAFRTFQPVSDQTQPAGYRFESDGTALWPNVDQRSETVGRARTPKNTDLRNIVTYIPGTGSVAFTAANAAVIAPHLGGADASVLIPFVRDLPLGPIIGSTPAISDPPSLQPPPDSDYGHAGVLGTYAGDHEDRRSIVWVGGNNGMLHAIDARTGFEVWAFIPYNLLPKLQTLQDGQPIEQFEYFVDSSPKLAEVKLNGDWRTVLVIGQAYGGTFYQAFDVTEAGMGGPPPDSDNYAGVLASFADPNNVPLLWSFPRYSEFDTTMSASYALADGYPGGSVRFYGDVKSSASAAEKSVGFTWSAPALTPLNDDRTVTAAIVGSGYFPAVEDLLPGRGPGAPRAGRSLYLIDIETGTLVGGSSACGGSGSTGCVDVGDQAANS